MLHLVAKKSPRGTGSRLCQWHGTFHFSFFLFFAMFRIVCFSMYSCLLAIFCLFSLWIFMTIQWHRLWSMIYIFWLILFRFSEQWHLKLRPPLFSYVLLSKSEVSSIIPWSRCNSPSGSSVWGSDEPSAIEGCWAELGHREPCLCRLHLPDSHQDHLLYNPMPMTNCLTLITLEFTP